MRKDKEKYEKRKSQIGSGDRSERIRTYNFPQGRITDHRIEFSTFNITDVMKGDLEHIINPILDAKMDILLEQYNAFIK